MKEYEIINNNKKIGKVKLYKENYNKKLDNSLIITNNINKYTKIKPNEEIQTYEITYNINNIDELYDIISKYTYNVDSILEKIEYIKKYNNIKTIKKNTELRIIVPEIYLNNLNIKKTNINLESLLKTKVYFIKKVLENNPDEIIKNNLEKIIINYKTIKQSNEYEFKTIEEKEIITKESINKINKLIDELETKTKYKYNKDYIVPIKISGIY